jgi:predicted metal-dependent hydrolase
MTNLKGPSGRATVRDIQAGGRYFPIDVARHPRARRYVVRVTSDGRLRLTVPRGASIAAGLQFAERQANWIAREWRRHETRLAEWSTGTQIWFRGERVPLDVCGCGAAFGDQVAPIDGRDDIRLAVERHLRALAAVELPARSHDLARERAIPLVAVNIRDQRSRWGSCSPRGKIALNWRLIQMPPAVTDYVVLHELAHRKHPNHSMKFWRHVESICPWWRSAERWLRKHGRELL